jgi:hypothetical protein
MPPGSTARALLLLAALHASDGILPLPVRHFGLPHCRMPSLPARAAARIGTEHS